MQAPVQLGYFAIPSPDPARSAAFWGAVFGWRFAAPDENGFIDIESTGLPGGIAPMPGDRVLGWFRVPNIRVAAAKVRALGGSAPEASEFSFGWTVDCIDTQGVTFSLWQMAEGLFPEDRRGNGVTAGEPAYFVIPSPDLEKGVAFYGPLLGWEFAPAEGNGYRHATNSVPAGGLAALPETSLHPWFRVDDMAATIDRVRASGGSAGEPQQSESGGNCDCVDDQGVTFSVWQPAAGL
jgi:predicted enzyme related to lactoylglutathione lyase